MPRFYRDAVLPFLKAEVASAYEHGAHFGYIWSSGVQPMLCAHLDGIDVLIGIDPIQETYTDMTLTKQALGDKVCLWGGVFGAVIVEQESSWRCGTRSMSWDRRGWCCRRSTTFQWTTRKRGAYRLFYRRVAPTSRLTS